MVQMATTSCRYLLAREFDIDTRHVRERLIGWAKAGLISLDVYADRGFRPFADWQNTDEFFEYGNKIGHVRVKLLADGDEYLEPAGNQAQANRVLGEASLSFP